MIEFVDAALLDGNLATCAVAEILHQVYNQDNYHVLITMDGYN